MSEQNVHETCQESGVCAYHAEEVNQRKKDSGKLNWILGILSVGAVLVLANYTFTYISKQEIREDYTREDSILRERITEVCSVVGTLAVTVGQQGEQNRSYLEELRRQNKELTRQNDSLERLLVEQRNYENSIDEKFTSWGNRIRERYNIEDLP